MAFKITADHGRTTDEPHGVPLVKGVGYLPDGDEAAVVAHRYRRAGHQVEEVDSIPDSYAELAGDTAPQSPLERRMAAVEAQNGGAK